MANKPFECSTEGLQIAGNPSKLYNIDLATGQLTERGEITPASVYNAAGFNIKDNNVYAMRRNTMLIINNDQTIEILPIIPNLPDQSYIAGDINLDGLYYIYSLSTPQIIYIVDVDPQSPTYLKLVDPVTRLEQTNSPFGIPTTTAFYADWAFSPIDNNLYAAISNTNTVACINPLTGEQTILTTTGLPNPSELPAYGAAFADSSGAIYFINNNTGNIYRTVINGNNATANLFSIAEPATANDGARCALAPINALTIEKIVDKVVAKPNDILTYTIIVKNISLLTLTNVIITDVVPNNTTIIADSIKLNGTSITGNINTGINIDSLVSNQVATLTFQVLVNSNIPTPTTIINTASVTFDSGDTTNSNPVETLVTSDECQPLNDIITSVALEQTALSHILNAEGEKIQKAQKLNLENNDLININKSVESMINTITKLELILQNKLKLYQKNK